MSQDGAASGWLARIPLRVTLVVALVLLMTGTLVATGYAASSALRGYLLGRLDDDVRQATPMATQIVPGIGSGGTGATLSMVTPDGLYLRLTDADGTKIASNDVSVQPDPSLSPERIVDLAGGGPTTVDAVDGGSQWRAMVSRTGDGRLVVVAYSLDEVDATVARLQWINLVVGAIALVILGLLGYSVVRSSLRPLDTIEETAAAIASGKLDRRVPYESSRTEVGRLGRALNGMLAQIESAFRAQRASEAAARASEDRMRQFVADAGHELRTPLTSIRGYAELVRQGAVEPVGGQGMVIRRIEDTAADMGVLVDDLLLLARLDQHRPLERRPVDLLSLATDVVRDARVRDPERPIELDAAGGPVPPVAIGDESRLRQVVANLVGNALTHTPTGAEVAIRVGSCVPDPAGSAPSAWLEVRDTGPGLAAHQVDRVFERFYRGDQSRSRDLGGIGLGLSIVASIVDAHGGSVSVRSEPGDGASFRVELPAALAPLPASSE
jgi:two-component system, OmpR family, sensor kinase